MFVTMKDLGQNQQQSWWDWLLTGQQGPPPKKAVKATVFNFSKSKGIDAYTVTPSKAWGGTAYEAPADEDINVMGPQGSQDEALTGLAQLAQDAANPVTAIAKTLPPISASVKPPETTTTTEGGLNKGARFLACTVLLGSGIALACGALSAMTCASGGRRFNKRRNG